MNAILPLVVVALLSVPTYALELFPLGRGPSDHSQIIMWAPKWEVPVLHDTKPPVDCNTLQAEFVSQCVFTYTFDDSVPEDAAYAVLRVKAKAQVQTGPRTGSEKAALVYGAVVIDGAPLNHFIHTETYGDDANGQRLRREVEFAEITVPIIDRQITIQVGKRIIGKAEVEFVVYLEGYLE